MRFVDLFCGLGGFHLALRRLGHECVFASEIDDELRDLYEENFGMRPDGNIRDIPNSRIPNHDVLCAGFPCQPFSKAGEQNGVECPKWGDLYEDHVLRIVKQRKPTYVLLENVPNIQYHGNGKTWRRVVGALKRAGYDVQAHRLSPHEFGVPQIRERVFIVGSRGGLNGFAWPKPTTTASELSIRDVLDRRPPNAPRLSRQVVRCLETWQDFLRRSPRSVELPSSFPLWSMEYEATYPFEEETPYSRGLDRLGRYKGAHGIPLMLATPEERLQLLPSYARTKRGKRFPGWKIDFIRDNRAFLAENKRWIDRWLPKILEFPPSLQKLEWNCKGEERNIWQYVIQFRASGVRVKRPTTAPSLVAMTSTQVPIIGWERRYMTPRECSRLQSMQGLRYLPNSLTRAYESLGNAVNAKVVELVAKALLGDTTPAAARRRATRRG